LPSILSVVVAIVLWQVLVPIARVPEFILPVPTEILATLLSPSIPWPMHTLSTLTEALLGFLLAVAAGVPLAVLISTSRGFKSVVEPLLVAAQLVPKVAFVPILFLWIGLNITPRILTVFLVCFFPIVVDTTAGLGLAEQDMIDLVRSYNPSKVVLLKKVLFPTALPNMFAGLKVSITLAILGAVVAEFVSSDMGLGFLIYSAQNTLDTKLAFASLALLILMGFLLYGAVLGLERLLVPWREKRRW
jgi:NitT/TauT family transport system permease protein